jgi:hypothetical protein
MNKLRTATLCFCLALPLAAQARPASPGIQGEIDQDLADARKEVRIDLAKAREELQTGNLELDNSLRFASDHGKAASTDLPHAEITPQGDLLIEGKAQQIDAAQREQLLAYRGQIVAIALGGLDIGQKSADAALDAVDGSWVGLLFSAMTGRLERRVKQVVNEQVQPAVVAICRQLPAVMDSQQQLAASVPAFRPYANLEADDVEDCESEVREEFASN